MFFLQNLHFSVVDICSAVVVVFSIALLVQVFSQDDPLSNGNEMWCFHFHSVSSSILYLIVLSFDVLCFHFHILFYNIRPGFLIEKKKKKSLSLYQNKGFIGIIKMKKALLWSMYFSNDKIFKFKDSERSSLRIVKWSENSK